MVLKLVPAEDQVGTTYRGKKRIYREVINKKKEIAEKKRIDRMIANAIYDEIEERNKRLEGKY